MEMKFQEINDIPQKRAGLATNAPHMLQPCSCHPMQFCCRFFTRMSPMPARTTRTTPLLKWGAALALSAAALAGSGCSSKVIDAVPNWAGGEPVGTPERPASQAEYPPVNDRPPPRRTELITEEEQAKIEQDLAAAHAAQAVRAKQVQKDRDQMLANTPQPAAKPASTPSN